MLRVVEHKKLSNRGGKTYSDNRVENRLIQIARFVRPLEGAASSREPSSRGSRPVEGASNQLSNPSHSPNPTNTLETFLLPPTPNLFPLPQAPPPSSTLSLIFPHILHSKPHPPHRFHHRNPHKYTLIRSTVKIASEASSERKCF